MIEGNQIILKKGFRSRYHFILFTSLQNHDSPDSYSTLPTPKSTTIFTLDSLLLAAKSYLICDQNT